MATFLAVVAALFGDRIKSRLFAPKLRLTLWKAAGTKSPVLLESPDGQQRFEDGRLYHVCVENLVRWPIARQVQIQLIRVEEPRPNGDFMIVWSAQMPLRWMHQVIVPLARDIGEPAVCDLCSVVKGKWLALHPMIDAY